MLERFDGYWGGKEPWQKVVRKEIPNDSARVAQLKAGQVDMIVRVPAADVPTLEKDAKLKIVKVDTRLRVQHRVRLAATSPAAGLRQGRLGPAEEPVPGPARARGRSISRSTARRSPRSSMEGLGRPVNQLVTPAIFGYNKKLPELQARRSARAPRSCWPRPAIRTASRSASTSPTTACPATAQVGTTIAQMLAAHRHRGAGERAAGRGVLPGAARAATTPSSMSGWGTLTGEAHYTLSSLGHSNNPQLKMGAFNVRGYTNPEIDKLIQEAAIEMDEGKRRALLEDAGALFMKER